MKKLLVSLLVLGAFMASMTMTAWAGPGNGRAVGISMVEYTGGQGILDDLYPWDQTVADYKSSYSFTVLPLAVDGKIIIGTSGAEFGIRGFVTARDAEMGEEVWKTHTIPAPGEPGGDTCPGDTWKYGGGSAWVTGAYEPELNNIYWGVGQPGPWDRHAHPGDNLYTNSTAVLDPDSGAIKFHFQYTPNDPYDYDGVNETVLADIDGQKVWLRKVTEGIYPAPRATDEKQCTETCTRHCVIIGTTPICYERCTTTCIGDEMEQFALIVNGTERCPVFGKIRCPIFCTSRDSNPGGYPETALPSSSFTATLSIPALRLLLSR